MFEPTRICITSTVPDRLNSNSQIRKFLAEGFRTALPSAEVTHASLEAAPSVISLTKPQLVIAVGGLAVDSVDLTTLKKAANSTRSPLVFWLHDDPYEFDYAFKARTLADAVFTNEEWCVPHYQQPHVFHLPLAANVTAHFREIPGNIRHDIDVFFCGVAYPNRVSFFRSVQQHLGHLRVMVYGDGWPSDLRFAHNIRLSTSQLRDSAQRSALTINIGRSHNIANRKYEITPTTPGPRTFEVALAGGAQIYIGDPIAISKLFELGKEILIAESPVEFAHIVGVTTNSREEILQIAKNAQTRALGEHTYSHRAKSMLGRLQPLFASVKWGMVRLHSRKEDI